MRLDHHVERLAEDHANAALDCRGGGAGRGLRLESGAVETNLVWVEVDPALGTAAEVGARLREKGVLVAVLGAQVLRACTHLDVTREQATRAAGRWWTWGVEGRRVRASRMHESGRVSCLLRQLQLKVCR